MGRWFKKSFERKWELKLSLNLSGKIYDIDKKVLLDVSNEAFLYLGEDFEANLRFVSEAEIKKLNKTFRGLDSVTDILSFKLEDTESGGDIAICYKKLVHEAQEWDMSITNAAAFLLVHGILHLSGYDHMDEAERVKMEKAEEEILLKKGITIGR
jgi:probable rRNA maturation factor